MNRKTDYFRLPSTAQKCRMLKLTILSFLHCSNFYLGLTISLSYIQSNPHVLSQEPSLIALALVYLFALFFIDNIKESHKSLH